MMANNHPNMRAACFKQRPGILILEQGGSVRMNEVSDSNRETFALTACRSQNG